MSGSRSTCPRRPVSERRLFQNLIKGWAANPSVPMTAAQAMVLSRAVGRGYLRDAAVMKLTGAGFLVPAGLNEEMTPLFNITTKGIDWIADGCPPMDKPRSKKKGDFPKPGEATLRMARTFAARSIFDLPRVHEVSTQEVT